ncbi:hypothetical protein GY45DRAFT_740672 [Cubamyces sp. BRFM 1775]|nr:hypothetical protein GY45DRAFT_740672 [Cubamyces sp. BRFM 1775]
MAKDLTAAFQKPDHFAPVKGRGGRVYCKIFRHEKENRKHQEKVKENALWDWNHEVDVDWGTPYVPKGESAWEYEPYTSERLTAYVNFWLEGIEMAERDEVPPTMDVFISRYDNVYQEENWGLKYGERVDEEEEWPVDDCEGVEGYYYDGGSFEPFDEGYEDLASDEETPWSNLPPVVAPQFSQASDATPETQPSEGAGPSQRNQQRRRRTRGRGRGRGKGKGKEKMSNVPNSKVATHRVEVRRAKMY